VGEGGSPAVDAHGAAVGGAVDAASVEDAVGDRRGAAGDLEGTGVRGSDGEAAESAVLSSVPVDGREAARRDQEGERRPLQGDDVEVLAGQVDALRVGAGSDLDAVAGSSVIHGVLDGRV